MAKAIKRVLGAGRRGLPLFLAISFVFGIAYPARARQSAFNADFGTSQTQAQSSQPTTPDSAFVIGDFDGDRQPDLATVEMARFNSAHSRYSISFQLSKGGPQTIGVTGPAGGLVLLARDVNGDRALDLVLVTAWRHVPVAVLLNDGAGNFAAADPSRFESTAVSSGTKVGNATNIVADRAVLSLPHFEAHRPERGVPLAMVCESAAADSSSLAATARRFGLAGRAPPEAVHHV